MTLSIIILSYNTKDLLRQCLRSVHNQALMRSRAHTLEVIVVDNASSDGSPEMVSAEFPLVKLITLAKNLGFAAGNNIGIKSARGDYLMLLNSDTQITDPNTFVNLLEYLKIHPQVGMITPKVVLPDGSLDPACHRGLPTPWNAFCYFAGLEKLFPRVKLFTGYHQTFLDLHSTHLVPAVAATAIIVRQEAVKDVGLLDEQFFLYGEDLDWCQRFADKGWGIVYYPEVTVLHHKSASGKKKTADSKAQQEAADHFYGTMKLFWEKHYSQVYPKWFRSLVYFGIDLKRRAHKMK